MASALRIIAKHVIRLVLVLAAVAAIAFTLAKLSPIDPIHAYLGPEIARVGPEQRIQIAEKWGLDQPAATQFMRWVGNLISGDLGYSMTYNAPVTEVLASRVQASLALMGLAWIISGALGFVLGVVAGAHQGNWLDRIVRIISYALASLPTFWLAILLLIVFSVGLEWAPVCCAAPVGVLPEDVTLLQRLHHLILPLATLSILGVAQIALHTRVKMIEIMQSDYALYAQAQGTPKIKIALRHGARNAALPALTLQFASLGELVGGSVLAEQVFSYPGLGRAMVTAGTNGDIALLLAIALCLGLLVSVGNMIADILYWVVDPRMKDDTQNPEAFA